MDININQVYLPVFQAKTRYKILLGGRGAGRSTAASQDAILNLFQDQYYRAAIMRNVFGDIRDSIFKECVDRLEDLREQQESPFDEALEEGLLTDEEAEEQKKKLLINQIKINNSLKIFTNPLNKNQIIAKGFKKSSSHQTAKLKSLANFTHVYIEEADENTEDDFNQLDDSIRKVDSNIQIWLMLNPPHRNHWIIKRWFNLVNAEVPGYYTPVLKPEYEGEVTFLHTTYKHNIKNLNPQSIDRYEKYKDKNKEHYYTMIRGLVSEGKRGRIFKTWKPISDQEYQALSYDETFGLDWGYSNDPLALIGMKHHNERLYFKEYLYEKGMSNQQLIKALRSLNISRHSEIIADSNEPKSIKEVQIAGFNIFGVDKPKGSILSGIKFIDGMDEVFYTEDSANLQEELQEYTWKENKVTKESTDEPVDAYNHLLDAARYATQSIQGVLTLPLVPLEDLR